MSLRRKRCECNEKADELPAARPPQYQGPNLRNARLHRTRSDSRTDGRRYRCAHAALQGESGAFTFAVSEFVRINHSVPSKGVFYDHIPELRNGGRTSSGLPVQVQLLGGSASRLAESAAVAHAAGATAIDINFGCPARTVNRHDGGATLLQYPKRIREIVSAIRPLCPLTFRSRQSFDSGGIALIRSLKTPRWRRRGRLLADDPCADALPRLCPARQLGTGRPGSRAAGNSGGCQWRHLVGRRVSPLP